MQNLSNDQCFSIDLSFLQTFIKNYLFNFIQPIRTYLYIYIQRIVNGDTSNSFDRCIERKKKIIVNYRVEKVINDGKIHFDCEIQIHDFES